jgi:ribosomal protein S3AE
MTLEKFSAKQWFQMQSLHRPGFWKQVEVGKNPLKSPAENAFTTYSACVKLVYKPEFHQMAHYYFLLHFQLHLAFQTGHRQS